MQTILGLHPQGVFRTSRFVPDKTVDEGELVLGQY